MKTTMPHSDHLRSVGPPPGLPPTARMIRNGIITGLVLAFLWLTLRVDFVIFAGILLAIFLGKLSELIRRLTGLPHGLALAAVVLLIAIAAAAVGWFFAQSITSQIDQLTQQLPVAIRKVEDQVQQIPWLRSLLQNATPAAAIKAGGDEFGKLFGIASNTFEIIAGFIVLVFIGLYIAAEPPVYAEGVLRLTAPARRARTRAILDCSIEILWSWMLGRLFSMLVIGVCTIAGLWLLGIALPVALGLLAGMLTFVPYLGTITAAVPALLIAFMIGPQHALYVLLLYLGCTCSKAIFSSPWFSGAPLMCRRL